jgi:hypothetical protein
MQMPLEWWKNLFEIGGVALLFLTFVFGAGALFTSTKINARQAEQIRLFNKQMTDAQTDLARQQEATANAQEQAAEANRKADQERLERLALEKQVAPRRLTGEQINGLTRALEKTGPPGGIAIVSALMDGESSDLANDFDAAFTAAGWKTYKIANRVTTNRGISVGVVTGIDFSDIQRVRNALTAIGVPHEDVSYAVGDASTSPSFQAGVLYLVVDHKPEVKSQRDTSHP